MAGRLVSCQRTAFDMLLTLDVQGILDLRLNVVETKNYQNRRRQPPWPQ